MTSPVLSVNGELVSITIGPWGFDFTLTEFKAALWEHARRSRLDRDKHELFMAIATEMRRQNVDPRSMTNVQIRNLIQAMEF